MQETTFYGHHADATNEGVIHIYSSDEVTISWCIVAGSTGTGPAVYCQYSSFNPTVFCSDVFGNEGGDWTGCIAEQYGIGGNISLDPWFCSPEEGDFRLHEDSPCAPFSEPNPECDLIGAWPAGCAPMAVPAVSAPTASPLRLVSANPTVGDRIAFQTSLEVDDFWGQLAIFDAEGRLVEELHSGQLDPGTTTHTWNRRDSAGQRVPAGVYFARLTSAQDIATRCFVLLR